MVTKCTIEMTWPGFRLKAFLQSFCAFLFLSLFVVPLVRNHSVPDNIGRDVEDEESMEHVVSVTPSPTKLEDKR